MGKVSVNLEEHRGTPAEHSLGPRGRHAYITSRYVWIHHTHLWRPPTDVYETESQLRIQVEVAGMEEADFSVTLEGRMLRISGARPGQTGHGVYHQLEIHNGDFLTEVELPVGVDSDNIHARYHDGFLIVDLAKISGPSV